MAIKAGSVQDFGDSMANAIEQAFQAEWDANEGAPLNEAGEQSRRILFAAIAQGVVDYLAANIGDALKIEVSVTQQSGNDISSYGSSVSVTQDSGSSNRVVSDGTATDIELETE